MIQIICKRMNKLSVNSRKWDILKNKVKIHEKLAFSLFSEKKNQCNMTKYESLNSSKFVKKDDQMLVFNLFKEQASLRLLLLCQSQLNEKQCYDLFWNLEDNTDKD